MSYFYDLNRGTIASRRNIEAVYGRGARLRSDERLADLKIIPLLNPTIDEETITLAAHPDELAKGSPYVDIHESDGKFYAMRRYFRRSTYNLEQFRSDNASLISYYQQNGDANDFAAFETAINGDLISNLKTTFNALIDPIRGSLTAEMIETFNSKLTLLEGAANYAGIWQPMDPEVRPSNLPR